MPRIAVTGHMNLSPDSEPIVYEAIVDELCSFAEGEIVGVSCIARGADSLFAEAVLNVGGRLEVVLPSANYRQTKVKEADAPRFDSLLGRAEKVHVGPAEVANRAAYEEANEVLLSSSDLLFAIWDGQGEAAAGGTASTVELARSRGMEVRVIWPEQARRN